MKKTILKSLLLGAAALTALTASANLVFEVADVEVVPGGDSKNVAIFVTHEKAFSAIELHFALIDGITFTAIKPTTANQSDWPTHSYYDSEEEATITEGIGNLADNTDLAANEYKVIVNCQANNDEGVVGYWPAGRTCVCRITIKADADFTGAPLHLNYAKSDYSDPTPGAPEIGTEEASNVDVCNITVPVTGTPLATIVAEGVNGNPYTVKDALGIAARVEGEKLLFVTDGNDNWIKVDAGEYYNGLVNNGKEWTDIKGGTLKGTLSTENGNQKLTLTAAPEEATTAVTYTITPWNLAQNDPQGSQYIFAPKPNSVINLKGYWWPSDQMFHGYTTGGQNVSVDFSWCANDPQMPEVITPYNVECIVQLKQAWSGSKAAPTDEDACENYTVYPTSISNDNVVTGVENLKGDKAVVSVQYVNVAGQVANTPFQGVNMVITRYADGSTVTTKVIK